MLLPEEAQETRTDAPPTSEMVVVEARQWSWGKKSLGLEFKNSNPGSSTHWMNDLGWVNDLTSLTPHFPMAETQSYWLGCKSQGFHALPPSPTDLQIPKAAPKEEEKLVH